MESPIFECVVNVSEGRNPERIDALAAAAGRLVVDVHSDADHHRSVFTMAGRPKPLMDAVQALARAVVSLVDLRTHTGVHPRLGALDVVPWVALEGWPLAPGDHTAARHLRDDFAAWAGGDLQLPGFLYGPERSLPEVRRTAWKSAAPDTGPARPHPSAGAVAVGYRPVLVAYNLWLAEPNLPLARSIASAVRGPGLRTLGLPVGGDVQVSCNLTDPWRLGPGAVYDAVARRAAAAGASVARAELVGLVPRTVLEAEPPGRWAELGLSPETTIEARLS